MMKTLGSLIALAVLAFPAFAADTVPVAKVYSDQLSGVEGELVPLVQAMPADKFNFVPTQGNFATVRTFAQQAKHIAAVLYMVSAACLGEKVPVDVGKGENGPDSVKTKDQVVKFLQDAFSYAHKATNAVTAQNQVELIAAPWGEKMARGSLAALLTAHSFDHYGQMVVFLRMNGIIPPASRK